MQCYQTHGSLPPDLIDGLLRPKLASSQGPVRRGREALVEWLSALARYVLNTVVVELVTLRLSVEGFLLNTYQDLH